MNNKKIIFKEDEIVIYRSRDDGEEPYIVKSFFYDENSRPSVRVAMLNSNGKPSHREFDTTLWDYGKNRQRIFKLWLQKGDRVYVKEFNQYGIVTGFSRDKVRNHHSITHVGITMENKQFIYYTLDEIVGKIILYGEQVEDIS